MLHLPLPFYGLVEFTLSLTTITLCHLGKQSEGEIEHTWNQQQGVYVQKLKGCKNIAYLVKQNCEFRHALLRAKLLRFAPKVILDQFGGGL